MKNYLLPALAAITLSMAVSAAHADPVPLDCSGDNCGPVVIPGNMPPAGEAQPVGTAPGGPIEAPETPNIDPIAPNEPPAP